ncbi:PCDGB protein, partial [Atrichornis clamosus]|nr:PCDGB protein [Atrichornis clamosus]
RRQRALLWSVLLVMWEAAWGQLRYSVPEEMPKGSFVGDVVKDLGLHLPAISDRGVRVVSEGKRQYFALHGKTGHLVTAERIDREQLCESVQQCVLRCELIVEGEMKVYGIVVEIIDINDNEPSFRDTEIELRTSETTAPALVLRASDGGDPARTGTARIRVTVLDANDNAPVFSQSEYTVRVPEDVPVGSVLVTVTATDADEGLYGHMKYSLKKITQKASQIFQLDADTGAITLLRSLDFEEGDSYELEMQAHDGGGLFDTTKVVITVTDVNDNAPEISVRSVLSAISEESPSGTVVALLHVRDRDSGTNGDVRCSLDGSVPFRLEKSFEDY